MTSILGTLSALTTPAAGDPMQVALRSAVASGTISGTDQGALSGALADIDATMKASPPTVGTDPATMQAKLGTLVDQEVAEGKLTTQQAGELKQLFATSAATTGGTASGSVQGTTGSGTGMGGALQSVVDVLREMRLAVKGQYSATGGTTAASPVGALVNGLA